MEVYFPVRLESYQNSFSIYGQINSESLKLIDLNFFYFNLYVMSRCSPTNPSWMWIKIIKTCSSTFDNLLKSIIAHVSWRSLLIASLNLFSLSLVTGPNGISNGFLGVEVRIASFPLPWKDSPSNDYLHQTKKVRYIKCSTKTIFTW